MSGPQGHPAGTPSAGELLELASALARRPDLWPTAVRQVWRLAPPGWWRRWPPSPLPPGPYLKFRLQTMYGPSGGPLRAEDLMTYLEWCRRVAQPGGDRRPPAVQRCRRSPEESG